ncbi:hypothetical protein AUP40_14185 [Thalassospira xiamenensis]|uniref:Uncharacterized protein n=3 Tax=Thalassospiraceae TaxID=2844866 RepID=A0ABR5Y4V9_9PROT|nr:hypothetical protein AUP40_14185 [Thalassospira xiamenensis]
MMMTEKTDWLPGASQTKPKAGPTKASLNQSTSLNGPSSPDLPNTSDHDDIDAGAEHLASFTVDPLEGEADEFGGLDGLSNLADDSGEFISSDVFFSSFCTAFQIGACVPPYLTSLKIDDSEMDQARAASDALYDICLDTPSMHFLVKPGGVWFQRVAAISAFALPKAMGVVSEIKAKKARPVNQSPGQDKKAERAKPEPAKEPPANGGQYDWAPT